MPKYDFINNKKYFFGLSIVLILIGLISIFFVNGLNYDIEFKGGAVIDVKIDKSFKADDMSKIIKDVTKSTPQVQMTGSNNEEAIVKIPKELPEDSLKAKAIKDQITNKIQQKYGVKKVSMTLSNSTPTVGKQTRQEALLAVLVACILMLIYITFRFEFETGVTAVIALLHDVLIMIGVYSIFKVPVNSAFVAAVLTIIGYSINDTIVVFDRTRENLTKFPKLGTVEVANLSINETLLRSVNTVVTVLITLTVLYFMGVQSIKEFTFPLIVGITSGCYSSIFIASPLWVMWRQSEEKKAVIK